MRGNIHITTILVLTLATFSTFILSTTSSFTNSTGSIFCVFGSSAVYRPGDGKFTVEDINPLLCTHLIFLHAALSNGGALVVSIDTDHDSDPETGMYASFNRLKRINPSLKTYLAVGGSEDSAVFSHTAADVRLRKGLARSAAEFIRKHGFDGIALGWFYPVLKSQYPADRENFIRLLKEMRKTMTAYGQDLAIFVSGTKSEIDKCYKADDVAEFVDYVLVLTMDYHGPWERKTGHYAPLYCHMEHTLPNRRLCVDYSITYWIKKGVPSHKLVMAIGTYGRSYKLVDPLEHGIEAEAEGPYIGGHYTSNPGFLGMNEMCEVLLTVPGAQIGEESGHVVPYVHLYDHWVSFDDELSVYYKVQYSIQQQLAGVFLWTMDTDDWRNKCSYGSFPLHVAAKGAMTGELILDGL
ncbi:chitinase-3-like protein 1 isoform X2 [Tachypleus tridentatus]